MRGLFLKDLINLKQQAKIYFLIICVWTVIGFMNKDSSFLSGMLTIFMVLIPITAISYDEKAKWERYALTMPVSRKDLILSKYILAFACGVVGGLFSLIAGILISGNVRVSLIQAMVFFSIGVLFSSVVLPVIFRFGVEKGRIIMLLIIMVPTGSSLILSKLSVPALSETIIEKMIYASLPCAIVAAVLSVMISGKVYKHKEF